MENCGKKKLASIFILCLYFVNFSLTNSLNCFACHFTYTNSFSSPGADEDEWCANDTLVVMDPDNAIRPCAPWEKFCSVSLNKYSKISKNEFLTTIVTMLKSFTSITRQCAETCSNGCEASGYGQDHVSCTKCCDHDKCNNNHTLDYYYAVMAQQFTSWTEPVKNEANYNKKNNLKFPY
ncbi:hypothetical protein niasHT_028558 [Heterodera trifolii]|uniref:Snake toxin/toxin-like domain-containing protein n=2 Tax=Heterodera trifolii TaxID=157864 RepID=A0ABD2JNX9_9BILA